MSTDEIRKEVNPEETVSAEEITEAVTEEPMPEESMTESEQEETVSEDEEEPIILIFPDDEEEVDEEETVAEETAEDEAYVPKAVMYRQNLGIEDKPKEKTAEEIAAEKICERAKLVRDGVAEMFERPIFNIPAWFAIGNWVTVASLINLFTLIAEMIFGTDIYVKAVENSAVAIVLCISVVVIMSVLSFVGMRITVVSARNNGGNMTTAGISMVIISVIILLVASVALLMLSSLPVTIVCMPSAIFLVSLLISAIRIKKTIIDCVPRRISLICSIMCFAFSIMNCWSFVFLFDGFDCTKESVLGFVAYIFSIISMFMFGIFIIAYNAQIRKIKKQLKAE